jgi:hypothetical protein
VQGAPKRGRYSQQRKSKRVAKGAKLPHCGVWQANASR